MPEPSTFYKTFSEKKLTTTVRDLVARVAGSAALRLVVTVAILAYLSRRIDMQGSAHAISAIRLPHLALVLLLVAVDRAIMILRWLLLLRASDVAVPTAEAARIFFVSSFVGSLLTAGVGADAARAYGLTPYTRGSEALASVAVDRLLGILSLVAMAVVGLLAWAPDWRLAAGAAAITAISVSVFWIDRIVRWLLPGHRRDGTFTRPLFRTSEAVSRYRHRRGVLVHVMAWSLAVQLLRIVQAYILALGLGLSVPFGYLVLVMPVGLLMLLLPISVSGFGLPQGVMVWLLRGADVPDAMSFALSTLIILTGIVANLPGLWLWLSHRRRAAVETSRR